MDNVKEFASKTEKQGEDFISRAEDGAKNVKDKGGENFKKAEDKAKKLVNKD